MKFLEKFRQSSPPPEEPVTAPLIDGIARTVDSETEITYQLSGRIDVNNFESILAVVSKADKNIIIDLKDVIYISSAGLKMMFEIKKMAKEKACTCRFENISLQVYNVFKMTGFASVLNITPPEE